MINQELFEQAQRYIPGGVNSPVRAFKSVGGTPIFIKKAQGAYLFDEEGKKYIDYIGSWGPMILGHAHPMVIQAVQHAAENGLSYGAPTRLETELAQLICTMIPSIEQIRFVNSGTEATMTALRLARGYTGRDKIIKFNGGYHGHSDSLLVKAGSGVLTLGIPGSPGISQATAAHTLVAEFNALEQVAAWFQQYPDEIAAIIVEPIAGNMSCVLPQPYFLTGLRELCDRYHSVLIFDEVMTGFRVAQGGAQAHYGVTPDLTTLGKIIGGGLPVGALGGQRKIMQHLAPIGPVYQAGTLSGNPLAMTAGLTQLRLIGEQANFFEVLTQKTHYLMDGLRMAAQKHAIPFFTQNTCGMFGIYFTNQTHIHNFNDVAQCNIARFNQFFQGMLAQGVYLAPSAFEAGFISMAHTHEIIEETIRLAEQVFARMAL